MWADAFATTPAVRCQPLPPAPHEPQRLLHELGAAHRAGRRMPDRGTVDQLDGRPAVWQPVKTPPPRGNGQGFTISWTVPRAERGACCR